MPLLDFDFHVQCNNKEVLGIVVMVNGAKGTAIAKEAQRGFIQWIVGLNDEAIPYVVGLSASYWLTSMYC